LANRNCGGRPHGSEEEDWLEAERQLAAAAESDQPGIGRDGAPHGTGNGAVDTSLKDTFPASDPPASHLPDVPPSNAADKWHASGRASRTAPRPTLKRSATPGLVAKAAASEEASSPPVDETDYAPPTAPHDIGEG